MLDDVLHAIDLLCHFGLGTRCIRATEQGPQHAQRRLQRMREIAKRRAVPLGPVALRLQQGIEILRDPAQFTGPVPGQRGALPHFHFGNLPLHTAQRLQQEADHHRNDHRRQPEHESTAGQKLATQTAQLREVGALVFCRHEDIFASTTVQPFPGDSLGVGQQRTAIRLQHFEQFAFARPSVQLQLHIGTDQRCALP